METKQVSAVHAIIATGIILAIVVIALHQQTLSRIDRQTSTLSALREDMRDLETGQNAILDSSAQIRQAVRGRSLEVDPVGVAVE